MKLKSRLAGWLVALLVFLVTSASPVFAADIPLKSPPPAAYDWSGFYIGGHLGAGWESANFSDPGAFSILDNCCMVVNEANEPGPATAGQGHGFLGGAQAGWMYQFDRYVVGGEVDFSAMDVSAYGTRSWPSWPTAPGGLFVNENFSVRTKWTATSTVVAGIAQGNWLFYGKTGLAWADNTYGLGISGAGGFGPPGTPFAFNATTSQIVSGWTGGIGVKWALSDHLFLNAEYDFLDFGLRAQHLNGTLTAPPQFFGVGSLSATFDPNFEQSISEFKVGLNYKFNPGGFGAGTSAPLLTKAPAASTYDWSGPYVGVHIGGGWDNVAFSDPSAMSVLESCCLLLNAVGDPTAAASGNGSGFLGGVQAGWAYQIGHLVVGGDVDFSGTDMTSSGSSVWPTIPRFVSTATEFYSVRTNWTATSTATVGFAEGRWQFYEKTGAAWADNTYGLSVSGVGGSFGGPPGTPFASSFSADRIVLGWTAGLGFKYALTSNLFLNAEYDYLDFGTSVQHVSGSLPSIIPLFIPSLPGSAVNFDPRINQNISEIKVGLNYKFAPSFSPADFIVPSSAARTKYDWSGLYIGAHVGGGWQDTTFSDPGAYSILTECCVMLSGTNYPTAGTDANGSGVLGGVQAGWMHQIDRLVVGADFDFSDTSMKGAGSSTASASPGGAYSYSESYTVNSKWTATSTATLGVASGTWLFYGKAGAAFVDNSYGLNVSGAGGNFGAAVPFSFASSTDRISVGWTSGIGVKWGLSNDLFVNAEYDFMDFGSATQTFNGTFSAMPAAVFAGTGPSATFQPVFSQTISEFKLGLNYKFSSGLPF